MFVPFVFALAELALSAAPRPGPATAPTAPAAAALVGRLSRGEVAVSALIDPKRGLIVVDHFDGASDEPRRKVEQRYCGDALQRTMAELGPRLVDASKRRLDDGVAIECAPGFGGMACVVGATMEWDPAVHLVFTAASAGAGVDGLALRAVAIDDEVLVTDELVASVRDAMGKAVRRLEGRGCR